MNSQLWNPSPTRFTSASRSAGASKLGCTNPCCCGNRFAKRIRNTRRKSAAPARALSEIFSNALGLVSGSSTAMLEYTACPHPFRMRDKNRSHASPGSESGPSKNFSANENSGAGRTSAHARRMCSIRVS